MDGYIRAFHIRMVNGFVHVEQEYLSALREPFCCQVDQTSAVYKEK